MKDIDAYYARQEEPNQSCLLALRSIVLQQDENISETQKYGMPCFCYKKKSFCYLWIDKKTLEPYLLLVEGKLLEHPQLEAGSRAKMKIFRVNPKEDIPIDTVRSILKEALNLYWKGVIKAE